MNIMQYSIKDLEKLSSVKAHTLRIWEKRYGLIKPQRTSTNIRYYSDAELKKLLNVTALLKSGMKISHIAKLSENELTQKALYIYQTPNDYEDLEKKLVIAMVDLNEPAFNKIFNKSIMSIGFEDTMINVIYPFLNRIGVLWQTGSIIPAHEHFVSNFIRQKLIVAIDSIQIDYLAANKKFILFLPEGELHELGLLFYNYLIRARGHRVLYLGQSTPIGSLIESHKKWQADYLVYFSVSSFTDLSSSDYLNILIEKFTNTHIIVSGQSSENINLDLHPLVTRINRADEFARFLKAL